MQNLAGFGRANPPGLTSDAQLANAREAQLAVFHPRTRKQALAISVGLVTPSFETMQRLEAGKPRLLTVLHPAEEVPEG
ncbi:hypothetical protein A7Q10_07585 [Methylacidiphilum caldifontis]|uniref:Uncharacterized protein n=1 Tax=Methylacidiphilum caldifontis TaxID=2795386 RepID=A0A4Y8PDK9_9BACT|nr:hypothetical protein A7Q10_07585 [Methylacidiphilum caldifontis]